MKKLLLILVLILAVAWICFQVFFFKEKIISFSDTFFYIEIAESQGEKEKGLSGKEFLNEKNGLLLKHNKEDYYEIWMKDMLFPIDIIWINKDLIVVDIEANVSPDTYPEVFSSQKMSLYILEINAGLVDKYGIKIGDKVGFKNK